MNQNPEMNFADPTPRRAGKLTQAARQNSLKQARGVLLFLGVLTLIVQGAFLYLAEGQVREVIGKEATQLRQKGQTLDEVKLEEITKASVRKSQFIIAGFAIVGVIYIVMGLAIYKAPLPITVTALILYLGSQGVAAMFDPSAIVQGLIIKIVVIVALIAAIRAAFASERDRKALATEPAA